MIALQRMRTNWETRVRGERVVLVPYREAHVPRYHRWMESEELRQLTGSERLSLEQEREMQQAWREDKDKCTFIVLGKELLERGGDEVAAMIGDTNLFLQEDSSAEVEIMIAEEGARGKRLGWEAILLMLRYAVEVLQIKRFEAKIKIGNLPSIKLFRKIGFTETSRSEVFGEITFSLEAAETFITWLREQTVWNLEEYIHEV